MTKRVIVVSDSHGDTDSLRDAFAQAFRHGNIAHSACSDTKTP